MPTLLELPYGTGRPKNCPSCKSGNIHRTQKIEDLRGLWQGARQMLRGNKKNNKDRILTICEQEVTEQRIAVQRLEYIPSKTRKEKVMKVGFAVQTNEGVESKVYDHFGSAPAFIIVDTAGGEVLTVNNRDLHHAMVV